MNEISIALRALTDVKQATNLARFFKTGKGQYGEGDKFLGLKVPQIRYIVGQFYKTTTLPTILELLHSEYHEERLCALLLLVKLYNKAETPLERETYYKTYLANTTYINNWDLVDLSAPNIIGNYLFKYSKQADILLKLAKSDLIWDRRIAILSSFYYIRENSFDLSFEIIEILIADKHDLIHKAIGWMLREIGKRNKEILVQFLEHNKLRLPRTALRYAIEHFTPEEKVIFMQK